MVWGEAIGVACIRDPRDPAVWSRTPARVCEVLATRGRLGPAFWGLPTTSVGMVVRSALAAALHGDPTNVRGYLHDRRLRGVQGRHIARAIERAGVSTVLHFSGDRYLPLPEPLDPRVRHYMIMDSTWSYWAKREGAGRYRNAVDDDLRRAYHQMTHLFCIPEHAKDSLVQDYGIPEQKITIVGTGTGVIQPFHGEKDFAYEAILFAGKGRLEGKGAYLLIEAFKRALAQRPKLQLWLVGDPSFAEVAATTANTTAFGFLELPELQALFERASLFAMPAVQEPWGLVLIEALLCKTPLLGLNRGAFPEIARQGRFGFVVEEPTADAVAAGVLEAFSDTSRLQRMGEAGQRFAMEHFTWENVVDRMLTVIDRENVVEPVAAEWEGAS